MPPNKVSRHEALVSCAKMLKFVLQTCLALAIAIAGGGVSVWYVLNRQDGIGAIQIGQWTAFPDIGTPAADPYSKARVAREGILALGQAEGLSFFAERDAQGQELRRNCAYTIEGSFPTARLWTLYAADKSLNVLTSDKPRPMALHSNEILRRDDNSATISVGARPAPGNWLIVQGKGAMYFVLTFYDTSIATSTGLSDISLPQIQRVNCDA